MPPNPITYALDSLAAGEGALQALSSGFETAAIPRVLRTQIYHDTFDGRLARHGSTLTAEIHGAGWSLALRGADGEIRQRAETPDAPGFARDLPSGPLRNALDPLVRMRRLLPLVSVERDEQGLGIQDPRGKTVLRAMLLQGRVSDPAAEGTPLPRPVRLRLLPVGDCTGEMERAVRFLQEDLGLQPESLDSEDEFSRILGLLGKEAGGYSSKFRLHLQPWMRSDQAAKTIHRKLLDTIRANQEGTLRALDSEFLHDFRVAVRRTRAALGQIPRVFPPARVRQFRRGFSWLGKATGSLRDLDVHVLRLQGYRDSFPRRERRRFEPLERYVQGRLVLEREALTAQLESSRYRDLMEDWASFLQEDPPAQGFPPNAGRPIRELASEQLRRVFDKALKQGRKADRAATAASPAADDDLHRFRIQCKKLRYLLEFFQSLYDPAAVESFVLRLKALQDTLGDYNDYRVLRAALREWARALESEGAAGADTFLLIGELLERTQRSQARERRKFGKRFEGFAEATNQREFRTMLVGPVVGPRVSAERT